MEENSNIKFLKGLNKKSTKKVTYSLTPNMSGKTVDIDSLDFTDYVISDEDFEKIFKIIEEELLLISPKENLMGFIEGYFIYNLDGKLLLLFGKKNLPEGKTLESIFSYCHTLQNKTVLKELKKEKILIHLRILPNFGDYCY